MRLVIDTAALREYPEGITAFSPAVTDEIGLRLVLWAKFHPS
jgi:hypothetical protein